MVVVDAEGFVDKIVVEGGAEAEAEQQKEEEEEFFHGGMFDLV